MLRLIRSLFSSPKVVSKSERSRSIAGAALGILFTAEMAATFTAGGTQNPVLIAPMGVAAVLLFATPSSPLVQLWPVIGGSLVSAIAGVTVAHFVPDIPLAAALAIAIAMGLMTMLRCLHPPGGAIALNAVVGGPPIHQLGYDFVL